MLFKNICISKMSHELVNKILKNVKSNIYYEKLFLIKPESSFHNSSPFKHLFIKTPLNKRIMYQSCKEPKLTFEHGYTFNS
jgi:hypothetical protein